MKSCPHVSKNKSSERVNSLVQRINAFFIRRDSRADRQAGAFKGKLRSPAAKTPAASDMRSANCMQL